MIILRFFGARGNINSKGTRCNDSRQEIEMNKISEMLSKFDFSKICSVFIYCFSMFTNKLLLHRMIFVFG